MSKLEKIVYSADFAEPNRQPFEGLESIRKTLLSDLDKGFIMVLHHSAEYVEERGKPLFPLTQETLEYYDSRMKHTY